MATLTLERYFFANSIERHHWRNNIAGFRGFQKNSYHSVWKSPKKSYKHCERSELRLHFVRAKVKLKMSKQSILRVFENLMLVVKQYYQIGHFYNDKNLWKMPKLKCIILSNFQTLCASGLFIGIVTKRTCLQFYRKY